MRRVSLADVRMQDRAPLASLLRTIGRGRADDEFVEEALGVPLHLRFALDGLVDAGELDLDAADDALASIPFYSLCRGLLLPLAQLHPTVAARVFGIVSDAPPDASARERLLEQFIQRDLGLSAVQKVACLLGDPFLGKRSTFKRDSMLRLLGSLTLKSRRELLDRLTQLGDIAQMFAELCPVERVDPPLTAAEVLAALRFFPSAPRTTKHALLRSLLGRMSRLEAYFLVKLVLRRAGFGFDYQGPLVAQALARKFQADADAVSHAAALTDFFSVARLLDQEGAAGLRRIQIRPLSPLRPALAQQGQRDIERFPVWVERKYDGVRLMLHKTTDALGNALVAAFTRTRNDWLEDLAALQGTIRALPCRECIVDGELFGMTLDGEGRRRPATLYDILGTTEGVAERPVRLQYAAFDLLYLDGRDLTELPLRDRRALLSALVQPLRAAPLPVPIELADGQLASSMEEVNRRFQYFRSQGHEGVVCKDFDGPYRIAVRDPSWIKRKPEVTLDLVLCAGIFAVRADGGGGMFGSYALGARRPDGSFEDVGDVAGLDLERDRSIQQTIALEGLVMGRTERASSSGARAGLELRPRIVATIKFEGVVRDNTSQRLSLRGPKIATLRPDKAASEASTVADIEALYRKERLG